jgi:Tol biopolymer transport system component
MAQRFDEKRLTLTGDPMAIAEHASLFSVSAKQTLIYQPISAQGAAPLGTQQIVRIDRSGEHVSPIGMQGTFGSLRLSPNGHRLAFDQTDNQGNTDVWVLNLDRGVPIRLTTDPLADIVPRWSPDGEQIVYTSARFVVRRMFIRSSLNSHGSDQPIEPDTPTVVDDVGEDWSRDRKYLVFVRGSHNADYTEIWVKPMFGDGKPFAFVQSTSLQQGEPRVSPNSRWLAYTTNESGTYQIVVQTFPQPSDKPEQVTDQGGMLPTWRGDGQELYYLSLDGKIMAVPVKKEDGDKIMFGPPTPLFPAPLTVPSIPTAHQYDVTSDGEQFFFIANTNTSFATPNDSGKLSVVVNWTTLLGKK